jgi:hypothetical protein
VRIVRRVVLVLLVAGAGSALFASPAFAGGVDGNTGILTAAVYNATPYTWTLVDHKSFDQNGNYSSDLQTVPAATISPGGGSLFGIGSNYYLVCFGTWKYGYDGYFTYRVDLVGGPPEYVTVGISQLEVSFPTGCGLGGQHARADVYITTAPPPPGWHPALLTPPASSPSPQQLTYSHNVPYLFDQTVSVVGNYTVDASTNLGAPFVDLLNSLCSGQTNTTCSFTQTTPITYGPGTLTGKQAANNCDLSSAAPGGLPSTGTGEAPPDNDPNYYQIEYSAAQSASLSVGGGVTVSTEFNLFNTIASEASVSVEAEHEWEEVKTYTREAKVYIPSNSWGFIWVAPTVGRVTGTLVATIGSATFTANNFTEVRNGVTGVTDPLKQPTPAFNIVTKTRPMTAAEKAKFCGTSSASRLRAALQALKTKPPARLVPGRSVAHVALGDTQEAVLRRLGWPATKRFPLNPCAGMPGCTAVRGLGGTWNYKKRKLSVVFGPDRRVAAIIHSGNQRTNDGVGKDSTIAHLRGKFPRIYCAKFTRRIDCTVKHVSGQRTTKTVFRLGDRLQGPGTRWKTNKVLIYVDGSGRAKA